MKLKNFQTIIIMLTLVFLFKLMFMDNSGEDITKTSYSDFVTMVEDQKIKEVTFQGQKIVYLKSDSSLGETRIPEATGDSAILNDLLKNDVVINDKPISTGGLGSFLLSMLPTLLLIGFFVFMMQKQAGGIKDMTSLKFKFTDPHARKVTFDDVEGCDEAKNEVSEVVDYLKNSQKYLSVGAKIPHGVLLQGPPGTGKTLLAKAVAGEAGVPFISISGSDFVEKFVGVGASRVRELFEAARKNAPCIVFVDEIDAMGRQRSAGGQGGDSEREQTLNQMLVEMDGFNGDEAVIVIAATNRSDILDDALTRPGRFDRQVHVGLPDVKGREAILRVHARNKKTTQEIKYREIAQGTSGFSGADLANLVNEAAIHSVRDGKTVIDQTSFEKAKDKIIMGNARQGFVMKEKEKSLTAYHEAGHAIVGWYMEELGLHDPVYKVSIIPRERALGVTVYLPEEDKYSLSRGEALARITTLYGGRIAEEMVTKSFDDVTTGASNDIERATSYATKMVTNWGLSQLGNGVRQFQQTDAYGEKPLVSAKMNDEVDNEIAAILEECYKNAEEILQKYSKELEVMHDALMVRETITQEEVKMIMNGDVLDNYENYESSFKVQDRVHDLETKRKKTKNPIDSIALIKNSLKTD